MVENLVTAVGERKDAGSQRPGGDRSRGNLPRRPPVPGAILAPEHHAVTDTASVLGAEPGGLPPAAQAAIGTLMAEVEKLRTEVTRAHGHEALLLEQADHHPILPVLHRRSFHRELTRLLTQTERAGLSGSLIWLHVSGIDSLRESSGLAAGEAALNHAFGLMKLETEEADPLGYLDGGDFVIALAAVPEADAAAKARNLLGRFNGATFLWQGKMHPLTARLGMARFRPAITAEDLLLEADASRRGVVGAHAA